MVAELLPVAVAIALSPFPLIPAVLLLLTPRATANGGSFLAGWFGGLAALTAVLSVVTGAVSLWDEAPTWVAWIRIVLGAALVGLGVRAWLGPSTETSMPSWMAALDGYTPGRSARLGLILAVANPKSVLLVLAGAVAIGSAELDPAPAALVVLVFAAARHPPWPCPSCSGWFSGSACSPRWSGPGPGWSRTTTPSSPWSWSSSVCSSRGTDGLRSERTSLLGLVVPAVVLRRERLEALPQAVLGGRAGIVGDVVLPDVHRPLDGLAVVLAREDLTLDPHLREPLVAQLGRDPLGHVPLGQDDDVLGHESYCATGGRCPRYGTLVRAGEHRIPLPDRPCSHCRCDALWSKNRCRAEAPVVCVPVSDQVRR